MNCLIKKRPYKTDKSHVFIREITHTLHMNMFLILLIYHLINVFFDFPGAYSRKYTALLTLKKFVTYVLHFQHKKLV